MMIIERGNTKVCFCQETLAVTVEKDQTRWEWADGFQPKLICKEGSFSFLDAVTITHETLLWVSASESEAVLRDLKKTA